MRLTQIENVKDGNILGKTLYDGEGRVLLASGSMLTQPIIDKIKSLSIYTLYIEDEYSEAIIEDVIKPEIRRNAIKMVRNSFYKLSKYNSKENYTGRNLYKESEEDFKSIYYIATEIIEEILSQKNVMIGLVDIKSFDDYTYQHSVNVAVIALIIGIKLKFHKYELFDLCIGALLHDVGKMFIPNEILNKKGPLTEDEFKIMKEHTVKGYDYLKGFYEISVPARIISLQHHERLGGQGYPEGRLGDKISILSRIVAVADVYDAMTSDRVYRRAIQANEALEYIMANSGTKFDYKVVQAFSKSVIPYPEGSIVRLSNDDIAVVIKINEDLPLRPDIKIIYSEDDSRVDEVVKLIEENSIVIKCIEENVPEKNKN
ncbi:HD-GYP domain-containing protein [Clostridium felsineum]|uniref:HD-GYP domain-containing protein n=1 Tax=Clostridium felsineum TaxID=36839 RepID=UPI00098C5FE2|nr:HD-GYP domain-containing protein [Clostridium felsineum]MCR3761744.1 HD-GYP domain-containing protein [Clostridium felsineum]